jgi:V8-like Glu-specific endopeptidase
MKFIATLAAALVGVSMGQVETIGEPMGRMLKLAPQASMMMATVDVDAAIRADFNRTKDQEGGMPFGLDVFTNMNAETAGNWDQVSDDTWVWRLKITSFGAHALLPVFDAWNMPEGASFYAYSDSDQAGSFTAANNKENNQFAIRPVVGDTITLEYNGPREGLEVNLQKVIHVYRGFKAVEDDISSLGYGDSGSCNVNVACSEADDWRDQVNSVAVLLNTLSRGYCSGSMINNAFPGKQTFLTAAHCRPGSNDILMFNYQSPTCNNQNPGLSSQTVQGLTTLASSNTYDFQLMEVRETIPASYNVYANGWTAEASSQGETKYDDVVGIHHPSIDVKKISRSSNGATNSRYLGANGNSHWWVKTWELNRSPTATDYGTTEGGSSGSPLFNSQKQIIGQLHGGYAACGARNIDDYYGATYQSFKAGMAEHLVTDINVEQMGGAYLN